MSHSAFVYASYGVFFAIFAALLIWLLLDRRTTLRELKRLEDAGIRRRSDQGNNGS